MASRHTFLAIRAALVATLLPGLLFLHPSAALADSSVSVTVDRQAYVSDLMTDPYQNDQKAIYDSVAPGAPPPTSPTSPGAKITAHSFVHLNISSLPQDVKSLIVKLVPTSNGPPQNANASTAQLQACILVQELAANFDPSNPPRYDCTNPVKGRASTSDGSWTFDLAPLLQTWRSGKNTGAAILPVIVGNTDDWSLSFDRSKTGTTAVVAPAGSESSFTAPAPAPAPAAFGAPAPGPAFVASVAPPPAAPPAVAPPVSGAPTVAPVIPPARPGAQPVAPAIPSMFVFPGWVLPAIGGALVLALALAFLRSPTFRANVSYSLRPSNLRQLSPVGTVVPLVALALVITPSFGLLGSANRAVAGGGAATAVPGGGPSLGTAAPGGGIGAPSPGTTGPGGSGSTAQSATAFAGSGSGPRGSLPRHGVSATQILVGEIRGRNSQQANAKYGANVQSGDEDKDEKAVVDYINLHGGVLGRQLVVSHYDVDENAGTPTDQVESGACTQFTQDTPVYAVLATGTDNFKKCLGKAGVPLISDSVFSEADATTFQQFPTYFETTALNITRQAKSQPDGLIDQKFFSGPNVLSSCPTSKAKIGLLSWDDPAVHRAVDRILKPELANAGLAVDPNGEHYFPLANSTQTAASDLASISGVVFQFQSNCIDRLIVFDDSGGALAVYFSRNAQSQGYNPRYGMESGSACETVADPNTTGGAALVDPSQFKGAVCVGWNPTGDVELSHGSGAGPGFNHCLAAMKAEGADQSWGSPYNTNSLVVGMRYCDGFFFLQQAANTSGSVDPTYFAYGVEHLTSAFASALTYYDYFGPGSHGGPLGVRESVFDSNCTCFVYKSGIKTY